MGCVGWKLGLTRDQFTNELANAAFCALAFLFSTFVNGKLTLEYT